MCLFLGSAIKHAEKAGLYNSLHHRPQKNHTDFPHCILSFVLSLSSPGRADLSGGLGHLFSQEPELCLSQTLQARRMQINDIELLLKSPIDSRLLYNTEAYMALKLLCHS